MAEKQMDAVALLKADHRKVEEIFADFEKAKGKDRKEKLARQACMELKIHAQIEEEIFYPACEGKIEEDLLKEAYVEHDAAKVLINEIEAGGADEEFYDAKVKVLSELIEHHVKEEEQRLEGMFAQAKKAGLGVVADIQPAWLYLDANVLTKQFGYDRVRYFQPLKSLFEKGAIAGGGSDHMQKIGSLRSINPYNPFLAMATTITRRARWYDGQFHPEECLSREQAIRFYTTNNAYLLFLETETGSLETGKLADLIVLDRDLLTCDAEHIAGTKVLQTYLGGQVVYEAK